MLDPQSQYRERSRYYARLEPYVARFPREQIFIWQEELLAERRETVSELYRFAGVDDSFYSPEHDRRWHVSREAPASLAAPLRRRLVAELSSDATRFQELVGWEFSGWRL